MGVGNLDYSERKNGMSQTENIFRFFTSFLSPAKLEERKGEVTPQLEIYLSNGRHILDSARVNYSFGGLHAVFRKAFSQFNIRERDINSALILGFGAGSVASILCNEYKKRSSPHRCGKGPCCDRTGEEIFSH